MWYPNINVWYAHDLWQPLRKGHSVENHWPKLQRLGTLWLHKYGTRKRAGGLHLGSLHSGGTSNLALLFSASISPSARWVYTQHSIHNEATTRTVLAKYLSQAPRTGPAALSPLPCLAARLAFRAVSGVRCGQLSCSGQWKGRRGTCWKPECDSWQSCVLFFHHRGDCGTEARMAWGKESCPHSTDQHWEPLRSGTLWLSYYCHYWYPESCSWLNTEKLDLIWGEDRWPSISSYKFQVLRNTGKGDLCVIPCVQETLHTARDPVLAIIY